MARDTSSVLYRLLLVISAICFVLFGLEATNTLFDVNNSLAYRRDKITDFQVWRLITGNFLHTNLWHLLMNLAGLWVIVFLHEVHYRYHVSKFCLLIFCLCLQQSIGLYFLYPSLVGFVGLSGILHGLFAFGAVMDIKKGFRSGYLLLLGVILKVAYEQYFGSLQGMSVLIGAKVATESHLLGLVAGVLSAIVWLPIANRYKYRAAIERLNS
ncbi:rhombosortase [Shewanella intestini]|uniref:Rhombosortase n=1 Tax=Shewanella intestini TaxID=2017544 RepID=A0ABS5HZN3_9GAMM|nr:MULTISPECIES: rhombosortase [Shewanella]MBR9727253.1 rhombosortase [Shewanella intestini]MRG36055.1 rhombosortase [Shewanella sp. XMDDZSB0408]